MFPSIRGSLECSIVKSTIIDVEGDKFKPKMRLAYVLPDTVPVLELGVVVVIEMGSSEPFAH